MNLGVPTTVLGRLLALERRVATATRTQRDLIAALRQELSTHDHTRDALDRHDHALAQLDLHLLACQLTGPPAELGAEAPAAPDA
ncbi:hypothetical protein GCM10008959_10660 [Deinococcus seoulensis]|uniref:Uncharacterized protein n=2 Tax=Deinococcus TaxID=1298 RepID=A0ABQ2RNY1_9DEIO|nr:MULTISPECIES: hypothetical protein [Deinococcus]GGR51151.1 hypothetical protein GCM10008959_10660 [Deinococcus seoulensis]GGS39365.1 hypothetical protein GCM10008961_33440 [Deinococcus knuensis]